MDNCDKVDSQFNEGCKFLKMLAKDLINTNKNAVFQRQTNYMLQVAKEIHSHKLKNIKTLRRSNNLARVIPLITADPLIKADPINSYGVHYSWLIEP